MKQIRFDTFGPPSRVGALYRSPDVGPPSAWEVIVEVEAFPINPADLAMLAGRYGTYPSHPHPLAWRPWGGSSTREHLPTILLWGSRYDHGQLQLVTNAANYLSLPSTNYSRGDILQSAMLKVNPATAYCMLNGPPFGDRRMGDSIRSPIERRAVASFKLRRKWTSHHQCGS